MSKHTPGPWVVTQSGSIEAAILPDRRLPKRAGIGQQNRMAVATICNSPEPHMLEGEAESNARLIAAAPEMLDLLQRAVSVAQVLTAHLDYLAPRDRARALQDLKNRGLDTLGQDARNLFARVKA